MLAATAAATAALVAASLVLQAPPAAARTSIPSANTVTFTHSRLHPERTVVGSALAYTRTAPPLVLTVTVVPNGRTATVTAVVANTSGSTLSFGSGLRVDAHVLRDGRTRSTSPLVAPAITSLAPGARRTVVGVFALAPTGRYTVSAVARY